MGDGAVGIDRRPTSCEQRVGLGPLQPALVDGREAGEHANLEVLLPLFVLGELLRQLAGLLEQRVGLGRATFDERQVGQQQVGLGVVGIFGDGLLEQQPRLLAVADDDLHLGERQIGGRQLGILLPGEFEELAGARRRRRS